MVFYYIILQFFKFDAQRLNTVQKTSQNIFSICKPSSGRLPVQVIFNNSPNVVVFSIRAEIQIVAKYKIVLIYSHRFSISQLPIRLKVTGDAILKKTKLGEETKPCQRLMSVKKGQSR